MPITRKPGPTPRHHRRRATNEETATFTVTRDIAPPLVTVTATPDGLNIAVTWNASDAASGLQTCALEVQEEGSATWEQLAGDCAGTYTYDQAQLGVPYTFRLTATDHVGNQAEAQAGAFTRAITKYYYFGGQRVAEKASGG